MGEARRRKLIKERDRAANTRYSQPWPCSHCEREVSFRVYRDWAHCPNCNYSNRRGSFGFKLLPQETPPDAVA